MSYLVLDRVCKSYGPSGKQTEVLSNVSLSVERGEFVAIVGPSGSGKTTLVAMIAGLMKPDSGTIVIDGNKVQGTGLDRGVVFQNYSLLPWLSVFSNVLLAVEQACPDWPAPRRKQHVERYLRMVNLWPARDKRPACGADRGSAG